jgi:hypothetical protein
LVSRPATRGPIGTISEPNANNDDPSNDELDDLFAAWGLESVA